MSAQHTPGPWLAVMLHKGRAGGWRLCDTQGLAERERDLARSYGADALIMPVARALAVPALYALAERVAEHFKDTDAPLGAQARAALAQARGESG